MNLVNSHQSKFDELKVCVIVPTFNNSATLDKVLAGIKNYTKNILVVNDGSIDGTTDILKTHADIAVLNHPVNLGKGMALRNGFNHALEKGFEYAITIDSDGQHFPSELPAFLEKLEQEGPCLIMGSRNMEQNGIPAKSSFGNKFSNFWFLIETGIRLPDTQTGYRLYPIHALKDLHFFSGKFEFEIEVIVRAAWKGIKFFSIPVSVYYEEKSSRITHFRPFKDFSRISILNTVLVFIAFVYINPRNFIRSMFDKNSYKGLSHQIFNPTESIFKKTFSLAFGVFMGIVPIWGFQLVTAVFVAIPLRLNKALVIIGAHISIPPMIPLIIFLSYELGGFWINKDEINMIYNDSISLDSIHLQFIQYLFGSITLAFMAFLLVWFLSYFLLSVFKKNKLAL